MDEAAEDPDITEPLPQQAGVWANAVKVVPGGHEVTLDFPRLDHAAAPPTKGVLVARVAFSYSLLGDIVEALNETWEWFAWRDEEVWTRGRHEEQDGRD